MSRSLSSTIRANCGRRSAQLMATVLRGFLGFLLLQGRYRRSTSRRACPRWRGDASRYCPVSWRPSRSSASCDAVIGAGKRADATTRCCCCWHGWVCGPAKWLSLPSRTSTGGRASCWFEARGFAWIAFRCPKTWARPSRRICKRDDRPRSESRRVFLQSRAPHEALAGPAVGAVRPCCPGTGPHRCPHQGAHLLRHSLATTMLRRGASMAQIGQVLRHQLPQTTEIYAKVNWDALRALALPWPGGGR